MKMVWMKQRVNNRRPFMFRKIMNVLFDEEEVVIEEEPQVEEYEIPSIKPLREKRLEEHGAIEPQVTQKDLKPIDLEPAPINEDTVFTQVHAVERPKSMMIDADAPKSSDSIKQSEKPQRKITQATSTKEPYQPIDIISPMFGGPEKPAEPLTSVKPSPIKRREPLTQVISPMYGRVETSESMSDLTQESLELDVEAMHSTSDAGVEIQASLYDYIEGLDNEE